MVQYTQGFGDREYLFACANFAQRSFYSFPQTRMFLALPREMRRAAFTWGLELEIFRTTKDFHWLPMIPM